MFAAVVLFAAPLSARAQYMGNPHAGHGAATSPASGGHDSTAASQSAAPGTRVIEMAVTRDGFVPAEVNVKKGEKVGLAITRQVEKTCVTELVVKDYGIKQALPLGKTVYVEFTPKKAGSVRYACGMDMVSGAFIVE